MAKTQSGATKDAIEMLMQDHKRVQKLFKEFEKLDHDDEEAVRELVESAVADLQIHSMLEEELFYPAARSQLEGEESQDLLNEAEVEHESADELIAKLQELEAGDEMYTAYFTVLAEYVKHHIKEEESELFPKVKKAGIDLEQLGEEMRQRREELSAEAEGAESETKSGAIRKKTRAGKQKAGEEEMEDEQEQAEPGRTRH